MLQAPMLQGLSLDAGSFGEDGGGPAEVDVGRRQIVQALMVAVMVVVFDKRLDLRLQIARQIVVLEEDAILQGLVPALDLALGLGMIWRAADVRHFPVAEPVGEITGDVARPIVRQQSRLVTDMRLVASRRF